LSDILGYRGKRAAIIGCFSGTGEACARTLVDLGVEVQAFDVRSSPVQRLA
jgi:NADP-dependent 3-hydroxy acid dehydrogenase YdfG